MRQKMPDDGGSSFEGENLDGLIRRNHPTVLPSLAIAVLDWAWDFSSSVSHAILADKPRTSPADIRPIPPSPGHFRAIQGATRFLMFQTRTGEDVSDSRPLFSFCW